MSVLNHIAQVAAVILLLEVIVVVLIIGGVFGGLAFGLRWVNGKVGWASEKANHYVTLGRTWLDRGLTGAALPVIKGAAWADQAGATLGALQARVKERQERQRSASNQPLAPVEAAEEPDILV